MQISLPLRARSLSLQLATATLACLLSFTPAAHADEQSHKKSVSELLTMMNMEHLLTESLDLMMKAQLQGNPALAPYEPKMREFFGKYMSWASLRDDFVKMYQRAFTENEVKEMIAFYKTPTGKKALQQMPVLMQEGAQLGAARVQEHMPELMESLRSVKPAGAPAASPAPAPAPAKKK